MSDDVKKAPGQMDASKKVTAQGEPAKGPDGSKAAASSSIEEVRRQRYQHIRKLNAKAGHAMPEEMPDGWRSPEEEARIARDPVTRRELRETDLDRIWVQARKDQQKAGVPAPEKRPEGWLPQ